VSLLVSIHDAAPAYAAAVDRLWSMTDELDLRPALLVVPDWHGQWPLERYPDFVRWLRARVDDGAEIVLHGERHDEVGLERSLRDSIHAWGRTSGEGEFLTLDSVAAAARIARGLERLRSVGLEPIGFVPPAWLAREDGHRAVGQAGLGFSEDDRNIRIFASKTTAPEARLPSPVVRWSARTAARAWTSVAVSEARWRFQLDARFPRIALHPQDLTHPATARSLRPSLERWLRVHRPMSYGELCRSAQPATAGR
jgi:predicted deacetylase